MISHSLRCVFVHVPKTGGNSIHHALASWSSDTYVRKKGFRELYDGLELKEYPKHDHLSTYVKKLGEERFRSYFKFGCVRNPWDRAVSWYIWTATTKGWGEQFDRGRFAGWLRTYRHLYTATRMLSVDGRIAVDYVARFESLQEDFNEILRRLSLAPIELRVTNRTNRSRYQDYYDDELRDLVEELFREDIENFGYEFEPAASPTRR